MDHKRRIKEFIELRRKWAKIDWTVILLRGSTAFFLGMILGGMGYQVMRSLGYY